VNVQRVFLLGESAICDDEWPVTLTHTVFQRLLIEK